MPFPLFAAETFRVDKVECASAFGDKEDRKIELPTDGKVEDYFVMKLAGGVSVCWNENGFVGGMPTEGGVRFVGYAECFFCGTSVDF